MADPAPLTLQNPSLRREASGSTLSGTVDGIELYFRTDGDQLVPGAEPFICAMLIPAMEQGRDIVIPEDLAVAADFLDNIGRLQDVYAVWYPAFRRVAIRVRVRERQPSVPGRGAALFFSGGLDACYSLLTVGDRVDTLVYVRGIDMQLDDDALYRQCLDTNTEIAQAHGKTLLPIESNVRFFIRKLSKSGLGWGVTQGCGLGALANALGFPLTFISASGTYDHLEPYGSHPLTDPMCSSDLVRIRHVGCEARRHEKLLVVGKDDFLLQRVRVCWQDDGLNCGRCEKCLQMRMALTLAGLRSRNFAPWTDHAELDLAPIHTIISHEDWDDNARLARRMGDERALREIRRRQWRYRVRQWFKQTDELWLGGALGRLRGTSHA